MLPITTFVEIRVVAGRSRNLVGRPHAVSGRPMLIHTCHAMSIPRCAVALRSRFQNGMVVAWNGRGMACVNQTRLHCVHQMGKAQSICLAERHGRGTGTVWYAWISFKRSLRLLVFIPKTFCFVFFLINVPSFGLQVRILSKPQYFETSYLRTPSIDNILTSA
jgi:hypothetical protein